MKQLVATAAIALATIATAEIRQETGTYIGKTNGAATVVTTDLEGTGGSSRGFLERVIITVGGTSASNDVEVLDGDGYTMLSNRFLSGTVTTWFTNSPIPYIGTSVRTFGASTNTIAHPTVTNTIKILYRRDQ